MCNDVEFISNRESKQYDVLCLHYAGVHVLSGLHVTFEDYGKKQKEGKIPEKTISWLGLSKSSIVLTNVDGSSLLIVAL